METIVETIKHAIGISIAICTIILLMYVCAGVIAYQFKLLSSVPVLSVRHLAIVQSTIAVMCALLFLAVFLVAICEVLWWCACRST